MALYLPDANILINALHSNSVSNDLCRSWLSKTTSEGHQIVLCELVEVALLRICTNPRTRLVPVETTVSFWKDNLWTYGRTIRISASTQHQRFFFNFIRDLNLCGNDINDAWLAALAIEQGATLVSLDRGFSRFPGLRWLNPAG
jgi:uncharacterized protein